MKKFLLMLVAVFMTAMSYAQTVLFEPEKPGNYELKVDTEKYPYLKGVEVNWYYGFDDLEMDFQSQGKQVVCAQKVPREAIITENDGSKKLHFEGVPEVWIPQTNIRTVKLFYTHKIETRSTNNGFYSKDKFDGFTCDTVATLHILKDLNKVSNPTDLVSSFQVNGLNKNIIDLTAGDTAKFTVKAVNELDIQEYMLSSNDEIIAQSDSGYFELIPNETIKDINLVVSNKTGEYSFTWTKTLKVYPRFDITNLIYSTFSNGTTITSENPNIEDIEVMAHNNDSISLKVETNILETLNPTRVTYTWNKDGKTLPKGVKANENMLTIPKYVHPDMNGVYNCLVTANDTTITASFKIKYESPSANDELTLQEVVVASSNGSILVNNVSEKSVRVVDTIGRIIYNKVSNSDRLNLNVHSGIYFVVVDNKTYKIVVR